jgi:hypothetical protein
MFALRAMLRNAGIESPNSRADIDLAGHPKNATHQIAGVDAPEHDAHPRLWFQFQSSQFNRLKRQVMSIFSNM